MRIEPADGRRHVDTGHAANRGRPAIAGKHERERCVGARLTHGARHGATKIERRSDFGAPGIRWQFDGHRSNLVSRGAQAVRQAWHERLRAGAHALAPPRGVVRHRNQIDAPAVRLIPSVPLVHVVRVPAMMNYRRTLKYLWRKSTACRSASGK